MAASRHWITGALATAALALALAGCSGSPSKPAGAGVADYSRGSYKIGKPYTIDGVTYYPAENMEYAETGIASWYGPGFHGRSTASGETYDQNAVSAAHKTLPMPTIVRVTNLDNGRSVIARVNDRGPFVPGRIIDMSKGGARQLGLDVSGTARVKVEVMRRESETVKAIAINGGSPADQMAALSNPPPVLDNPPVNGPGGGTMIANAPSSAAPAAAPPVVSASQPIWSPGDPPPPRGANYGPMVTSNEVPSPPVAPAAPSNVTSTPIPPPSAYNSPAYNSPPPAPSTMRPGPPVLAPPIAAQPPATPSAAPPAAGGGQLYVQAGAFSQLDNAEKVRQQLAQFGRASVSPVQSNGRELYRVRLGPFASAETADALRGKVLQAGYRDARVVSD